MAPPGKWTLSQAFMVILYPDPANRTPVLHWNGSRWSQVASPSPGGMTSENDRTYLVDVSSVSGKEAWAA